MVNSSFADSLLDQQKPSAAGQGSSKVVRSHRVAPRTPSCSFPAGLVSQEPSSPEAEYILSSDLQPLQGDVDICELIEVFIILCMSLSSTFQSPMISLSLSLSLFSSSHVATGCLFSDSALYRCIFYLKISTTFSDMDLQNLFSLSACHDTPSYTSRCILFSCFSCIPAFLPFYGLFLLICIAIVSLSLFVPSDF